MATALSSRSNSWITHKPSPTGSLSHLKYSTVTGTHHNGNGLKGLFDDASSQPHKRSSTQYFGPDMSDQPDGAQAELRGLGLVPDAWSVTAAEHRNSQADEYQQSKVRTCCTGPIKPSPKSDQVSGPNWCVWAHTVATSGTSPHSVRDNSNIKPYPYT